MAFTGQREEPDRPVIMGSRHVVAAGHYMAAQAGFQILEDGGNAIDAGVAAGIATGVLETGYVSFAGVAPIIIRHAKSGEVVTISGLGTWPKAASCEYFHKHHGGKIPLGIVRTVIPAAPDAWITALALYGTKSFAECAATAIRLAKQGFPMYVRFHDLIAESAERFKMFPSSAKLFLPGGKPPAIGAIFKQVELGETLEHMAAAEARAARKGGRKAGLKAARDAFYKGDIAATLVKYHKQHGGLVTREDMAGFRVGVEPPVKARFGDIDVYGCGPWCQGPMLMQILALLDGFDLKAMGHNSVDYLHTLTEAIKLAAADREAHYGDPRFVDVPMDELLSGDYNAERRKLIRADRAWPEMPAAGEAGPGRWPAAAKGHRKGLAPIERAEAAYDTSYLCAVDRHGNAFSATPSDGARTSPVIPGLGFVASARGSQSRTDPRHPSCVAPGKRPRLTPNPALAVRKDKWVMPFGTPGGDVQVQAMLQVFLNIALWGMDPQSAVEAPRVASYSFPSSFAPHDYHPGRLNLEGKIGKETGERLAARGHRVEWWPERVWLAGSVCAIERDNKTGVLRGGADPRRTAYAIGW